jgi:hypothetical protein
MAAGETSGAVLLLSRRRRFLDPLIEALSSTGLDVVVGETAADAAHGWTGLAPLGAIVDLLSVATPVETCGTLRDVPAAATIPIVLVGSGAEDVRSTNDAVFVGGDAYFQVPVEAARVVAKVAAYVGIPLPTLPLEFLLGDGDAPVAFVTDAPPPRVVPPAALPGDLLGDLLGDDDDHEIRSGDGFDRSPFTEGDDARDDVTNEPADDATDDARVASMSDAHDDVTPPAAATVTQPTRARVVFTSGRFDADSLDARHQRSISSRTAPTFVSLEPAEGLFFDGELAGLLWAAWSQEVTGAIEIRHFDGRTRLVGFERGEPVWLRSSLIDDRPERALHARGFITAARAAELVTAPSTSARRTCTALVEEGTLKLEELVPAARAVLADQLRALLTWPEGSFRSLDAPTDDADRVRLDDGFDHVIFESVRHTCDEAKLWSVLGGPTTLLRLTEQRGPLGRLLANERAALDGIDGISSVADVVFGSSCAPLVALRAIFLAVTAGVAVIVARGTPRTANEPAYRQRQSQHIDRERILDKLASARSRDRVSFLGVSPTATSTEVRQAVATIRERFAPARYIDTAFDDLGPALVEILQCADEAEAAVGERRTTE